MVSEIEDTHCGRKLLLPPYQAARDSESGNDDVHLFVCLFVDVCPSVAKMQKKRFSQKLSKLELWSLFQSYVL